MPDGVAFEPSTGVLAGTPTVGTGGSYALTITATNGVDPDATQIFTLLVNEAPLITSANATQFVVGQASSLQFTTSGYPGATFSETGTLPQGVTLSAAGLLSGQPTENGVFAITVTATNGTAPDATQSFTLTAKAAGAVSISNLPADPRYGQQFTAVYTVAGDGTPSVVSLTQYEN